MSILVTGIGSIGSRHTKNILSLGYTDVSVVSSKDVLEQSINHLEKFNSLDEALQKKKFDTAIICSPSSSHLSQAKKLLQHNTRNIYIEKPVSHSLEQLEEVLSLSEKINARIVIGYDLHFDPGMQKVKELISSSFLGKPLSANAVVGQYLPDWRPHEDYSKGSSAQKETGGGVLLDLIHEFDYLYWLFGGIVSVAAHYNNSDALNIETECIADVLLKFKNGVAATVHTDYLQPQLVRHCMITCSHGTISWNMAEQEVKWITDQKETHHFSYKGFERNERFKLVMKTFLEGNKDERLTSLKDGIESLKVVVAAKQSSEQGKFINPQSLIS